MNELYKLSALEREIRVGIIGVGSVGKGLVVQAKVTPKVFCAGICDIETSKIIEAVEEFDLPYHQKANEEKPDKVFITEDALELISRTDIDVVIEATNSVRSGYLHARKALESGKDVIMMNYEADLMHGIELAAIARKEQRLYSLCDGDQPTVLARLISEVEMMGFQVVMAGNVKGYLDRYTDPEKIKPEADKRFLDPKMCSSYTDGSKLNVEMSVLANALNYRTWINGMEGPGAETTAGGLEVFDLEAMLNSGNSYVDYLLGAQPKGGVFCIGHTSIPHQVKTLSWLPARLGRSSFYVFDRPYHLVHFEAMRTLAHMVLYKEPVLQQQTPGTMVYSYAKKDLPKGTRLDGIGGFCCYGLIENVDSKIEDQGVPICQEESLVLKRNIRKDEKIFWRDVE
jgi:predicted homoserine dehydrogenase-like protein